MAPGLPAVVPSSRVREDARFADGPGGVGEVGGGGEPFVGEGEDFRAEGGGDEVYGGEGGVSGDGCVKGAEGRRGIVGGVKVG